MLGRISSIKLINNDENSYWLVTVVDENGYEIGTFGDCNKGDSINFRKETFGIMKICNCMNLLNLSGENIEIPILVDAGMTRVNAICNKDGEYVSIDRDANMAIGDNYDTSKCEEGKLVSLESSSGIISTKIERDFSVQYFQAPMAYRGFKEIYDFPVSDEDEKKGADYFKYFVTQVMAIGKVDDLVIGPNRPIVSIYLDDNGKIKALGNSNGDTWLVDGDSYSTSNTPLSIGTKVVK